MGLRAQFEHIESLKEQWSDKADFYLVYGREAFPQESRWPAPVPDDRPVCSPNSLDERASLAKRFLASISSEIPVMVDDMNNNAMERYDSYPFRVYGISADGTIAIPSSKGASGFDETIQRLDEWLNTID